MCLLFGIENYSVNGGIFMVRKSDPSLTVSPLAEVTKGHVIVTADSPVGSVYTGNAKLDDPEVTVIWEASTSWWF